MLYIATNEEYNKAHEKWCDELDFYAYIDEISNSD